MIRPRLAKQRLGRKLAMAGVVVGVCAMASPGCGSSGLVGGNCAEGLTNCSNICVELDIDQYNCGHCGHACQSGVACISGKCGGIDEVGGAGYGAEGGDGSHYRDGSAGTGADASNYLGDRVVEFDVGYPQGGGASTGGAGNGGASGAAGSDSGEADACTPPYNDPLHCGDCANVCSGVTPVCAPANGSYECRQLCDDPLSNCSGTCVDLKSDPSNCGTCGKSCPSGACQGGNCVGVLPGDFVAICMNYRATPGAQTTRLLGNAIFLPGVTTTRILAYDQYTDTLVQQRVEATIATAAAGRLYSIAPVNTYEDVPALLNKTDYDVFLVYEQPRAQSGDLSKIGSTWASSLESFSYVGGVIVVLDGGQGVREMPQLLTSTRLFAVDDEVVISSSTLLDNQVSTDAVGTRIFTPLTCQDDTCVFETSVTPNATTTFVITEPPNDAGIARPVVVHMTRTAPQ